MFCPETVSVHAGSKRTNDPAPLMTRSLVTDAENIPPAPNPDLLPSSAVPKRRKYYHDCSETHQRRLRAQVRDRCSQVSREILGEDCKPLITFPDDDLDEECLISELLLIKEECNISDKTWQKLSQALKHKPMPPLGKLKAKAKELNSSSIEVFDTPNGSCGVQHSLTKALKEQVTQLLKDAPPSASFRSTGRIRVKLTADGTNIGRRKHCVLVAFILLDCPKTVASVDGVHPIALINEAENYEKMKLSLSAIVAEVEDLEVLTLDGETFQIEFFLCGDWKFLAMATGIQAATSTYACIWCKCSAENRGDTSAAAQWPLDDPTCDVSRTIDENLKISALPKSRRTWNVLNAPLFPTIPLRRVVIDNLHLFLRIFDVLMDCLIVDLMRKCSITKTTKMAAGEVNRDKYKPLSLLEDFVQSLGISFSFFVDKSTRHINWTSMTGTQKLKVAHSIDVAHLFAEKDPSSYCRKIQKLWDQLYSIDRVLSRPSLSESAILEFETMAKEWVVDFIAAYSSDRVTPYMHAMMCHVGQFLHLHGGLLQFTQQGLEKYNDRLTKMFFRSTNMKGKAALIQILLKQSRISILRSQGVARDIRGVTCGNCGGEGHYHLTCEKQCRSCGFLPYRKHLSHLVNEEGERLQRQLPDCQLQD